MGEKMNILQLTTYPLIELIHGGQIRSKAIQKHLEENNHQVISIAVYDPSSGLIPNTNDILFDPTSKYYDLSNAVFLDYLTGQYAANTDEVYDKLAAHVEYNKIDTIFLEQPWLYLVAKKLANKFKLKLVYSSQNVEYRLKQAMFKDKKSISSKVLDYITAVKNLEIDTIINSDLLIACTDQDNKDFTKILKQHNLIKPVITAGNGVQPFTTSDSDIKKWEKVFKKPYPVFIGSAHGPNSAGFWEMLNPGLTFLKPDEEVVIIGGVCGIILNDKRSLPFEDVNKSRLHLLGKRDLADLQAIISNSHLVILPICEGEGSNLKTAEALESGRPIVATSKAFRGYEQAMNLDHVYIEDNPFAFRERIRSLLNEKKYSDGTDINVRKQFYWENQLKTIASGLAALSKR